MINFNDNCLSIRGQHLFIEDCDTVDLVQQFGSPLFAFSEDQIRHNVRCFQRAFEENWPDGIVKVLPAAKANWLSAVQRIIASEGCGCDVYSPGELAVALNAGFQPCLISANGVPKDEQLIYKSIEAGVRITIDSVEEVDVIEKAANELNRVAKVRLRLKPIISGFIDHTDFVAEGLAPTDIAILVYKGGLCLEDVIAIGLRILKMKNVELVGFHQHNGRHSRSVRYWEEQMKAFARDIGKVCQALGGFQPQEIDIGGGFAAQRDPCNAVTDYSEPFQLAVFYALSKAINLLGTDSRYKVVSKLVDTIISKPKQTSVPSIEQYAEVCARTLQQELPRYGINTEGLMLQLEPGRAIHGNAGVHLTTVTNIKRVRNPIRWNLVVVDTTEFWFTTGRYEHDLYDFVLANKTDAPKTDKADIIGRSCHADRLVPAVPVPDVEVGDILAILGTGAYQQVSMSNFNALPRPATVLVTGEQASIIRRRETDEDVFRLDVVPEHLLDKSPDFAEN